ncbi:MAG: hypothetical protein M3237_06505 [Actinomycetota bacterium]|nr:hypothetical protein [Actinomycetota bacterium]
MTSTITRFDARPAPCGRTFDGEQFLTEDQQGLVTLDVRYACGCQTHREEFHDGSVHLMSVHHNGKVLMDEELRGE